MNLCYAIANIKHWNNFFYNVKINNFSGGPGKTIANFDETPIPNIDPTKPTAAATSTQSLIIGGSMTSADSNLFPSPKECTRTLIYDSIHDPGGKFSILEDIKNELSVK